MTLYAARRHAKLAWFRFLSYLECEQVRLRQTFCRHPVIVSEVMPPELEDETRSGIGYYVDTTSWCARCGADVIVHVVHKSHLKEYRGGRYRRCLGLPL